MTCGSCKCEFCWKCMGPYPNCECKKAEQGLGGIRFGGASAAVADLLEDSFSINKDFEDLNKRCANHAFARDIVKELKARAASAVDKVRDSVKLGHLSLLSEVCTLLMECRQVLSHACVLEFFMKPGHQRTLFDFLFKELEFHSDQTQELVENMSKEHQGATLQPSHITALRNRLKNFKDAASRNFVPRDLEIQPASSF